MVLVDWRIGPLPFDRAVFQDMFTILDAYKQLCRKE
jgi:hypothetical protein